MTQQEKEFLNINPLSAREGLPDFAAITPAHVIPAIDEALAYVEGKVKEIEKNIIPTWEGLLKPLEDLDISFEYTWGVVSHLSSVKNSDEMRKAYQAVLPKVVQISLRISQSKPIYRGLKAIKESPDFETLNDAKKRIIIKKLRSAEHAGVGLEGKEKDRFNEIANRMSKLSTDFSNNVLDATKEFELIITDKKDTEGWPENLKQLASQLYSQKHPENADSTPDNGPWRITLDGPCYGPFVQHSQNREQRQAVYHAQVTKATNGKYDNNPILLEMLKLRKEEASILGYKTFAELSLDSKSAPSVQAVYKMLDELIPPSKPAAIKDLEDLRKIAKESGQTDELCHWDLGFWAERLRETKFDYTDEQLRPYFSLDRVLDGLFGLANRLFGIKIEKSDKKVSKWHEDIQYFSVKEESGKEIASFFLDPYSRPEEKQGGAWMNECFGRRIINGKVRNPVIYLVCNSTPPVDGKPSLMSFYEAQTLFHEFGHGLQGMLSIVDEAEASGVNGVEWDCVELASQFMENWCYHKKTLLGMAKHYETGETLPEDLFEKIKASKNFRAGSTMLRQVEFSKLDMYLHHEYDPSGDETPLQVYKRLASEIDVFPIYEHANFLCSFSHIFAGGYCAGYYSYKWAEVLSADAFAAFEEVGLDNEEEVKKMGRKYRETILALGGSKDPKEVFRLFRGRDANTNALLRHSGLKTN